MKPPALCFIAAVIISFGGCSPKPTAPPLLGVLGIRELDAGVHVAGIAIGPRSDVWLAAANYGNGPSGVIRISKNGDMRRLSRPESFNRVAVDANDIAWFTVGAGASHEQPKLVRVDPNFRTHDYPLPLEGNFQGITIGPDGVPWFVDAAASEIGRIAADGKITYYGPASSDPTEIVTGPDHNLWFTEPNGNLIGRLNVDGTLDEFRVPTNASKPSGITSGSDGNIWFCESAADKIGRITPSGRIAEFRLPAAGAWPVGIAPSRGGTLWFTELAKGRVARITQSGSITEFGVPDNGYPGPIIRALDGTLWVVSNAKRDAVLGLTTSRSRLIQFSAK